jgi:hypothetical protein
MEDSSIDAWLLMLFLERVGQESICEQLGSINKLNEGAKPPQLRCDSCTTLNNDDRFVHVSSKRWIAPFTGIKTITLPP